MSSLHIVRSKPARVNRRGISIVLLGIILVALIAFVSLAIDIGRLRLASAQLQTAADASARAGALALATRTDTPNSSQDVINEAVNAALQNPAISAANNGQRSDAGVVLDTLQDVHFGYWNKNSNPQFVEIFDNPGTTQDERRAANAVQTVARRLQSRGNPLKLIFAPVIEELIFRGLIQGWLSRLYYERKTSTLRDDAHEKFVTIGIPRPSRGLAPLAAVARTSVFIPILITSLFFAAVHYPQMPAPFAIFVLSLGLGLLYERTRRLLPSIILHSLFNGFNTTVMVLQLLSDPHMDARIKSEPKTPPVVRIRDENGGLSLARDALAVRFPEAEGQGWSCNSLAIAV